MRRGFVIQLHSEAEPARFAGRVEHVDSGRADGFSCVEELVKFIEHTMKQINETSRDEMQEEAADDKEQRQ